MTTVLKFAAIFVTINVLFANAYNLQQLRFERNLNDMESLPMRFVSLEGGHPYDRSPLYEKRQATYHRNCYLSPVQCMLPMASKFQ
ncbi:unnamed protein product [Caenorhabditis auriculariae]|uniref:Uncharacterized protein n=1 Tax=Caenorhabditis auriculariae TaxID=2777116 RepID=A0A8S1H2J3_9PELO|nr:unnamed protein product [Caenorhabditis auriculariae]